MTEDRKASTRDASSHAAPKSVFFALKAFAPGVTLCAGISAAAVWLQSLEERAFGHPYVEALVFAILLGTAVRSLWQPGAKWREGVALSAKGLLEFAVMLLGASISFAAIVASGAALLGGIVT